MFGQAGFDPWRTAMMPHLSHGSTPQAPGLALWSCGMVLARSWALPAVRRLLAAGMQRQEDPVCQQLREGDDAGKRQRGLQRQAPRVETGFAPLLGGGGGWWQGPQLAWAIDATPLGQRLVVLAVRVVSRGGASPGA